MQEKLPFNEENYTEYQELLWNECSNNHECENCDGCPSYR
jgi:hypothetical protein